MASETFPVFIQQRGERVQVGTAVREADGSFTLQLGALSIGAEAAPARATRAAAPPPLSAGGLPTTLPNYGRSKGAPIFGASEQDLEYYANGARRSLADPSKERFHDKERALLAAIEQERERQAGGGGGGGGFGEEPPPPGDDDNIPF